MNPNETCPKKVSCCATHVRLQSITQSRISNLAFTFEIFNDLGMSFSVAASPAHARRHYRAYQSGQEGTCQDGCEFWGFAQTAAFMLQQAAPAEDSLSLCFNSISLVKAKSRLIYSGGTWKHKLGPDFISSWPDSLFLGRLVVRCSKNGVLRLHRKSPITLLHQVKKGA